MTYRYAVMFDVLKLNVLNPIHTNTMKCMNMYISYLYINIYNAIKITFVNIFVNIEDSLN